MVTEGARDRYQIINSTSVIFKVKVQDFKLILQLQLQPSSDMKKANRFTPSRNFTIKIYTTSK